MDGGGEWELVTELMEVAPSGLDGDSTGGCFGVLEGSDAEESVEGGGSGAARLSKLLSEY